MSIDTRSITHERPIAVNAISQCKRDRKKTAACHAVWRSLLHAKPVPGWWRPVKAVVREAVMLQRPP